MERALFGLWFVASAVITGWLGFLVMPRTTGVMTGLAAWALFVVPLSFKVWFDRKHAREVADVDAALSAWAARSPGAGGRLAIAIEEALDEEDERALVQLVQAVDALPDAAPFVSAAREWLRDNGGRSSREEHLARAREHAQALTPKLSMV